MKAKKTQIVVVGGGAGGLELVTRLGKKFGKRDFDIILVERNRTHIWKPLLHEVAAGSLDASTDEIGYRAHCLRTGYRYFFGSLQGIDRENRQVVIAPLLDDDGAEIIGEHRIRYDYLVIAIGSVANDFGTQGVSDHCIFLDEPKKAEQFRYKLLNHCLRVSRLMSSDPQADEEVHVAIVGGGATGVELSAELCNAASALRHYGLEVFDEERLKVTLLEAGPRILPALPEALAEAAHLELEDMGVTVIANARVKTVTHEAIITLDGAAHKADLKVWAAGVKAPVFLKDIAGLETDSLNRIIVHPTLQTSRDERIFALGDCASCLLPGAENPVPPRAQSAHQMAQAIFKNLVALIEGRPLTDFQYRDRGSLVSLSHFSTVGSLMGNLVGGRMAVEGRLARVAYISLYRMHQFAIHGWLRGMLHIIVSRINRIIRPRMKLH